MISAPGACFPGGVRRASSLLTLLWGLAYNANPPGVKHLPLQSTSSNHIQAGTKVQFANFFKFMALKVRRLKVVHRIPYFSFASAISLNKYCKSKKTVGKLDFIEFVYSMKRLGKPIVFLFIKVIICKLMSKLFILLCF